MIKNWCGTGLKDNKSTKFDKMVELMEKQLKLQKEILYTLKQHHDDARKMWKIE